MDFNGRYILDDDGQPQPCEDLMTWGRWFETAENRRVAFSDLGIYKVSTVFLGLDHSWSPMRDPLTYRPVLWETIAFDWSFGESPEAHAHAMMRYASREDALAGHERMVNACLKAMQRQIPLEDIEQSDEHDDGLGNAVPRLGNRQQGDDPADQRDDDQDNQNGDEK